MNLYSEDEVCPFHKIIISHTIVGLTAHILDLMIARPGPRKIAIGIEIREHFMYSFKKEIEMKK